MSAQRVVWTLFSVVSLMAAWWLWASPSWAAQAGPIPQNATTELDWLPMSMELLGGLALVLFGLDLLIKGLLAVAGEKMKTLLEKLTVNRVTGAISGAIVTAVIQSSSVTTVLVVGFVSAGLITVAQAASIIMGANLGTTITAQIVAFKITNLALAMIAVGFVTKFVAKLSKTRSIGELVLGLGLIFFGMNVMSEGMAPLRDYEPFLGVMRELQNPFYGILVGMLFTALVQSSSATIGIVIVMAGNGFLTLPAGIALVMGADIGTCFTAMLASIGKSRDAVRTALVHVGFNVLGVLIWLPFIGVLAYLASSVSPTATGLDEMATLAANTPREIANANTIFKATALLLFLPLIPLFIWVVYKLVPIGESDKAQRNFSPQFLDETLLKSPDMAMDAAVSELGVFREKFEKFFKHTIDAKEFTNLNRIAYEDNYTDKLLTYQRKILYYLGRISQADLDDKQQNRYMRLISVTNILESMIETVDNGIIQAKHQAFENRIQPSETMLNLLGDLAREVGHGIDHALKSQVEASDEAAHEVLAVKSKIDHLIQNALEHQTRRFKADDQRVMIFRLEMQIVDAFKRLHTLAKRVARYQLNTTATRDGANQ
jgi:phosphate:Na+ symporter